MFRKNEEELNYLSFIHLLIANSKRNFTKQYILDNLKHMKSEYNMIKGFMKSYILEYGDLSISDTKYVINNLHFMENTRKLIITNNNSIDIKELMNGIKNETSLEELKIINCKVDDKEMNFICKEFYNFSSSLKSLYLSDNLISEQSSIEFRDSIHTLSLLEELNLNSIYIHFIIVIIR